MILIAISAGTFTSLHSGALAFGPRGFELVLASPIFLVIAALIGKAVNDAARRRSPLSTNQLRSLRAVAFALILFIGAPLSFLCERILLVTVLQTLSRIR